MLRVDDYLAAVRALEDHGCPINQINEFKELAEKARKRDWYLVDLGNVYQPRDSNYVNGANICRKLLDDGWTAPPDFF